MTIENAIKSYCKSCPNIGFIIPTDTEGYWNINVLFINPDGMEDETQFDILPAYFDYGIGKCPELAKLWKDFCHDNHFRQNSVTQINIGGGW